MSPTDPQDPARLAHELRVHQAELETQNEELRRAQVALSAARDRYRDLFDFAPVGCLTLDATGCIAEINLTGASLLGAERTRLLGRPFARLVDAADRRRWHAHRGALPPAPQRGRIELALRRLDRSLLAVQLDALLLGQPGREQEGALRLAFSDISARRSAETDRRIAAHLVEAREDERQRVAHTLHEDLGQRLSALKMRAGDAVAQEIDAAIAVVRRIVNELRPTMLDELGLQATLEWLARDASRRLGIDVSLQPLVGELRLGERTSIGLYRIMEELLSDIARLLPRASAAIHVRQEHAQVVLQVEVHASGWPLGGDAGNTGNPRGIGTGAGAPAAVGAATVGSAVRDQLHLLGGQVQQLVQHDGARVLTLNIPLAPAARVAAGPKPP